MDNSKTTFETIRTTRRILHQIPELGYDLPKTHAYLKEQLESYGYEPTTVAQHGLVAVKKGRGDYGIAFRADMDALPIKEDTNLNFRSKYTGNMHACGHDGHMAMLLGLAERLSSNDTLPFDVMFVFEPAEETYGGAKDIIATGLFKQHNIQAIFALHLDPELEEGKLGIADGIMTAQDGDFDMTITGINAHGTQPHQGSDAVLAAANLIQQYHTIISRSVDPIKSGSINIGTVIAGEGRNILANQVSLTGSIRAFDMTTFELLKTRMRQIDQGIEAAFNIRINNRITTLHPPVYNDHTLFGTFCATFGNQEVTILKPMMLAEDFSYYQQVMPGLFIMLGAKNVPEGFIHPLHSSKFNFDEAVLLKGIETFERLIDMMAGIRV